MVLCKNVKQLPSPAGRERWRDSIYPDLPQLSRGDERVLCSRDPNNRIREPRSETPLRAAFIPKGKVIASAGGDPLLPGIYTDSAVTPECQLFFPNKGGGNPSRSVAQAPVSIKSRKWLLGGAGCVSTSGIGWRSLPLSYIVPAGGDPLVCSHEYDATSKQRLCRNPRKKIHNGQQVGWWHIR